MSQTYTRQQRDLLFDEIVRYFPDLATMGRDFLVGDEDRVQVLAWVIYDLFEMIAESNVKQQKESYWKAYAIAHTFKQLLSRPDASDIERPAPFSRRQRDLLFSEIERYFPNLAAMGRDCLVGSDLRVHVLGYLVFVKKEDEAKEQAKKGVPRWEAYAAASAFANAMHEGRAEQPAKPTLVRSTGTDG